MKTYQDIRTALFDLGYKMTDIKFREGSSVGKITLHMNDGKKLKFQRKTKRDKWKYLNENSDESKVTKDTDIKPQKYLSESVYEFLNENKSRYDSVNDDELEHLRRYGIIRGQEYFAKRFQRLCQKAAEAGLEFDIIQDLVTQALDQVDWEYAAQQVEKHGYTQLPKDH